MSDRPDIDIEVLARDRVATLFPEAIVASQATDKELVRHKTGLHFQAIPQHPITRLAAFPYETAFSLGFEKIDLLSCPNPYDGIASMAELRELLAEPIDWRWFENAQFVSSLFHMNGQVYLSGGMRETLTMGDVVAYYRPQSIMDLAALIAIKLPAKKYLIGEPFEVIRERIWIKEPSDKVQFKRSHGIAYSIVVGIDARRKAPEYFMDRRTL
jgi:hypothetical protein